MVSAARVLHWLGLLRRDPRWGHLREPITELEARERVRPLARNVVAIALQPERQEIAPWH